MDIHDSFLLFQVLNQYCRDDLTVLTNQMTQVASCEAMSFQGVSGSDSIRGWVVKNGMQNYALIARCFKENRSSDFWKEIDHTISEIRVKKSMSTRDDVRTALNLPRQYESWNALTAIEEGRNDLHDRDVSVASYQKALRSFHMVLFNTYDKKPRPPEYEAAMRWYFIAKSFQYQAFVEWRFLLDQNLGLGRKNESEEYVHRLTQMFAIKDVTHHYLSAKLEETNHLNFSD